MFQELNAKARPFGGTFDEAWDIRHDKASHVIDADDAEIGMERREGIICDLGACRRNGANEAGLSGVGKSQESDVGDHLEF